MYKVTHCVNQCRKSGKTDSNDHPYVFCKEKQKVCIAQRWCPEQLKYIISERAKSICGSYR